MNDPSVTNKNKQIYRRHTIARVSLKLALVLGLAQVYLTSYAQELEPRAYSNTPIGMNFLLAGYGYSEGSLLFDPSVPIQGANANVDVGVFAFAHSLAVADKSAKIGVLLPYVDLYANGFLEGEYRERKVSGFADPTFAFTINLSGAPALTLKDFRQYRQNTIIGATVKITAPFGQYDPDRLINIGTNRWVLKPEIGISKALGYWIVEGAAAVSLYNNNDDFFGGQKLEQDPIYSVQGHVVYNFRPALWAALDSTYYTGGRTTVNGVQKDNKLKNWRTGFTLTAPINKYNSIKLASSSGISTRTGTDFTAYLLAWQYRWGGGL